MGVFGVFSELRINRPERKQFIAKLQQKYQ